MGKTYECPFYRWEERGRVHCEGGTIAFKSRTMRRNYIRNYCANARGWKFCTIAGCLCRYYEEEEHGQEVSDH